MKKNYTLYFGFGIFAVAGCILLAGSYFFFARAQRFITTGISSQAEVIELVSERSSKGSYTYAPKFRFLTKEGDQIEVVSGESSNPPEFSVGESVEVLYDPINPHSVLARTFSSLWLVSLILGLMGAVFLLPATIGGVVVIKKKIRKKFLMEKGQRIIIESQKVIYDSSFTVNGQSPYRIVAEWQNPKDKKIYIFKSDNIWFDPAKYMEGKSVTVIINPANPKVHYVDTSFLPQAA
ncbi:DUF3592 domain-containing protein [Patescibacteria group bacterium]|nr:DUF3592 domain-containing protein [Patescibacteria group bacterium]MBU1034787.1 DUF3592 domain-containing protein [Patescibacteria group bacterium]MBU1630101.1 DUF3592 domain-containing protein [Patescibacteria group bacterium]MBU1907606.1 DUF3592 domain-containing protein [Patescibacteria group bacterium]